MLNVGALHEGFVLDHIKAGKAMTIYHDLKLDKLDCTVAIIKNAKSNKMGVKDIIKVECPIENLDLDILGFIDHNITVNIIKDEKIVEKRILKLPKQITNVIKCKNPVRHPAGPHEPVCEKRLAGRAEPGVHHLHDRGCQEGIVLRRQQSDKAAPGT